MPKYKKFVESDAVREAGRKVAIRQARRTAREEIRAIKKAGGKIADTQALEQLLKDSNWLLSQKDIRTAVRQQATIDVGNGITFNYAKYKQALKNIQKWNQGADVYNAIHKDEIARREVRRRPYKKWTVGKSVTETQETANAWLDKVLTTYSSPAQFFADEKQMYINNIIKAYRNGLSGMYISEDVLAFIEQMLQKHMSTHGAFRIQYMEERYEPIAVVENIDRLAQEFDFTQEWQEYKQSHNL